MKTCLYALVLLAFAAPLRADGNKPAQDVRRDSVPDTYTPEMWLYKQEISRNDDPALSVRRKAEERSAQRRQRIAARKWYGLSNARPIASYTPQYGSYSPTWCGGELDAYQYRTPQPTYLYTTETLADRARVRRQ